MQEDSKCRAMASIIKIEDLFERESVQVGNRIGVPIEAVERIFEPEIIEAVKKLNDPLPGQGRRCVREIWTGREPYEDYLTTGLTFFITPKHRVYFTRNGLYEAYRIRDKRRPKNAQKD